ncbi:MAG: hypothetical protein ACRDTF_08590 [Pseudonocardiaceae bacterium]
MAAGAHADVLEHVGPWTEWNVRSRNRPIWYWLCRATHGRRDVPMTP